jgi:hypothetical protein
MCENLKHLNPDLYDQQTVSAYLGEADNLFGKRKKKHQAGGGRKKQHQTKKALRTIHRIAAQENKPPEQVAQDILTNEPEALPSFIKQAGEAPVSDNQEAMAAQATMIHENNIEQKQAAGVPDYDVAEAAVFEDYEIAADEGEVDDFAPALIGSILAAGKNALAKINAKRVKNGKKPLFAGKKFKALQDKIKAAVDVQPTDTGLNIALNTMKQHPDVKDAKDSSDVQILIDEALKQARKVETKKAISGAMPLIIIGLVVVVIIARKM